jgi:hypothetical protein
MYASFMFCLPEESHVIERNMKEVIACTATHISNIIRCLCCCFKIITIVLLLLYLGHSVAQLVEALRKKSEGCGFDSR